MAGLFKRGKNYYAIYYVGGSKKRVSLNTQSLQVAKEKIRKLESAQMRGDDYYKYNYSPRTDCAELFIRINGKHSAIQSLDIMH